LGTEREKEMNIYKPANSRQTILPLPITKQQMQHAGTNVNKVIKAVLTGNSTQIVTVKIVPEVGNQHPRG